MVWFEAFFARGAVFSLGVIFGQFWRYQLPNAMTDELALQRMQRLADEAERYEAELLHLAAQMKLFRLANGREPVTSEELAVWSRTEIHDPIDPYKILTREEIVQVWEDAEDPARQSY